MRDDARPLHGFNIYEDLLLFDYNSIVHLDKENEIILEYSMIHPEGVGGAISRGSEGILNEVCPEYGKRIEDYFGIDLKDYGVEISSDTASY